MSAAQLAYRIVRGVRIDQSTIRIRLGDDTVAVTVGKQIPIGRLVSSLDKQRCIDYYSGTTAMSEGESEFVLTLDCTGLVLSEPKGRIREVEVAMPYLVEAELLDSVNMSKLKACPMCPFARSCKAGELGGSSIIKYLGQIVGPFFLPCHDTADYEGNASRLHTCSRQCVGAAVMRANIGVAKYMPEPLLSMPAEHDKNVFKNLDEFIAHHRPELSREARSAMLEQVGFYLYQELNNINARRENI